MENPTPSEAADMDRLTLATLFFRRNWEERGTTDRYWHRIHRHWARLHLYELRYLTGRPTKRRVPTHYGHHSGRNETC